MADSRSRSHNVRVRPALATAAVDARAHGSRAPVADRHDPDLEAPLRESRQHEPRHPPAARPLDPSPVHVRVHAHNPPPARLVDSETRTYAGRRSGARSVTPRGRGNPRAGCRRASQRSARGGRRRPGRRRAHGLRRGSSRRCTPFSSTLRPALSRIRGMPLPPSAGATRRKLSGRGGDGGAAAAGGTTTPAAMTASARTLRTGGRLPGRQPVKRGPRERHER